jgi:hypothetical protein
VHIGIQRLRSRTLALILVGGLHALAFLVFQLELAVRPARDTPSSEDRMTVFIPLSPIEEAPLEREQESTRRASRSMPTAPLPETISPISSPPSTAPTVVPEKPLDLDIELKRAAQNVIDRETEKARQASAFARRGEVPESLRSITPEGSDFAWSNMADGRFKPLPGNQFGIQVSERCMLVNGIIPACQFGKIEARSDLFADMNKLKTPEELGVVHSRSLEPVGHETRRRLEEVTKLLGEWRASHGTYPENLSALQAYVPNASDAASRGVRVVDTWDNPFHYDRAPSHAACEYDLYSLGPNGLDDQGERDDIRSCGSTSDLRF